MVLFRRLVQIWLVFLLVACSGSPPNATPAAGPTSGPTSIPAGGSPPALSPAPVTDAGTLKKSSTLAPPLEVAEMAPAQIMVTLNALQLKAAEILNGSGSDQQKNEALLAAVKARPEIVAAGISSSAIWAELKNGHMLTIPNNRLRFEAQEQSLQTKALTPVEAPQVSLPDVGQLVQGISELLPPSGLPGDQQIYLFNSLGSADRSDTPQIEGLLRGKGYQNIVFKKPGIEDLKQLQPASVLYWDAHGAYIEKTTEIVLGDRVINLDTGESRSRGFNRPSGPIKPGAPSAAPTSAPASSQPASPQTPGPTEQPLPKSMFFVLQSATLVTEANLSTYKDDLLNARLSYMLLPHQKLGPRDFSTAVYYGLSKHFVRKYMANLFKSDPAGLAFINSCVSDDPGFRQAVLDTGASLYMGWDDYTIDMVAIDMAAYFFDRLLGANQVDAEKPPQRAFDWQTLQSNLQARLGTLNQKLPSFIRPARLNFTQKAKGFGLLAPSLQGATTDEFEDKLTLAGQFGGDPGRNGRVTVGGQALTVVSWGRNEIKCELPPAAAGDIKVSVNGVESNVLQLSQWKGRFTYAVTGPGSLRSEIQMNVHFRGVANPQRELPADKPRPFRFNVELVKDSRASWTSGGSHALDQDRTVSWGGSGSIGPREDEGSYALTGEVDAAKGRAELKLILMTGLNGLEFSITGQPKSPLPLSIDFAFGKGQGVFADLKIPVGPDGTLQGGKIGPLQIRNLPTGDESGVQAELSWSAMTPMHPPKADAAL